MFAQLLEARGIAVDRRPGLGATEIAFRALRTGAIDVYPEYTGTGLLAILGEQPMPDPREVFDRVSREFRRRCGARWLPPLGFENTYAIAVRRETARRLRLATLSDLARVAPARSGPASRRLHRPARRPAGPRPAPTASGSRTVRALLPAVKYQALAAGEVDVIDGYSTDGLIARYDLVVLRGRPPVLPAVRGGGAGERRAGRAAAGGGGGADRAERPARRGDDAPAQPAARGGRRAGRADRGRRAGRAGADRPTPAARRRAERRQGEGLLAVSLGAARRRCSA